jgi:hypothetical protein
MDLMVTATHLSSGAYTKTSPVIYHMAFDLYLLNPIQDPFHRKNQVIWNN